MWSLLYLVVRALVRLLVSARPPDRADGARDLEILVLRHQLRVLQRTSGPPKLRAIDRVLLAARPHRSLALATPLAQDEVPMAVSPRDVRRCDLLGGLIHEYHGLAA